MQDKETVIILRKKIQRCFAGVSLPDKNKIAECQDWEAEHLNKTFDKLDWKKLDRSVVESNLVLPLFSPQAFHYFLPAYLLHSLDDSFDNLTVREHTIITLSPGKEDAASMSFYLERFRLFTEPQMNTVIEFLDWVRNHPQGYIFYKIIDRGRPRLIKYFERAHNS
jgi:hypothetical protein